MVTFATGLALPFFLLALFPSYLKRLPRSGGWMARVKVVMGFVILAASLKYLASLDQVLQWGLLTRERFLAAWIVLFAMAGLYLLGFVRLEGIKPDEHMGLGRLLTGMAFLIFAISLLPGMFGGKLGDLDAYVPLALGSARLGGAGSDGGLVWMKNQYREALDQRAPRRQAGVRQLHRLRLHQLPLDEGQHVHPAGDRRRAEELRAGGAVHRRHRRRVRSQSEAGAGQVQDRGDAVLRHPRSRREGARHLPGLTGNSAEFLAFLEKAAQPPP